MGKGAFYTYPQHSSSGWPLYISGRPVRVRIVSVGSLGTDGIILCGSARSNSAGCRYSAGIVAIVAHTGTVKRTALLMYLVRRNGPNFYNVPVNLRISASFCGGVHFLDCRTGRKQYCLYIPTRGESNSNFRLGFQKKRKKITLILKRSVKHKTVLYIPPINNNNVSLGR